MKQINVEGLPEAVVEAIEALVEALRAEFGSSETRGRRVELPKWPGKVIGTLTREEIYEDRLDRCSPAQQEEIEDEDDEDRR